MELEDYGASNLSVDSGQSYEGDSSNIRSRGNLHEQFTSDVPNSMMSEYQLESNLGMGTELEMDSNNLNSNSVYDLYGKDGGTENETENLNSNMSSNLDGTNNFTNLSGDGDYLSNDSIRQYSKKKNMEFDSENVKF